MQEFINAKDTDKEKLYFEALKLIEELDKDNDELQKIANEYMIGR